MVKILLPLLLLSLLLPIRDAYAAISVTGFSHDFNVYVAVPIANHADRKRDIDQRKNRRNGFGADQTESSGASFADLKHQHRSRKHLHHQHSRSGNIGGHSVVADVKEK